jgi:hypothetical protein
MLAHAERTLARNNKTLSETWFQFTTKFSLPLTAHAIAKVTWDDLQVDRAKHRGADGRHVSVSGQWIMDARPSLERCLPLHVGRQRLQGAGSTN